MSMVINSTAYKQLIKEDIEWLETTPRTLEREHILHILNYQYNNAERIVAEDRERAKNEPQP